LPSSSSSSSQISEREIMINWQLTLQIFEKTKQETIRTSLWTTLIDNRERGDLLVIGAFGKITVIVLLLISVSRILIDSLSYVTRDPTEILASHEPQKKKKKKYLEE